MARFEEEEVVIGSVVSVVIEGSATRVQVQVVGLPGKNGRPANVCRGFILQEKEKPRPPRGKNPRCQQCGGQGCDHCRGDEFIYFNLSSHNCVSLEGVNTVIGQNQELVPA
ncbi:MAG: hypothetical protein WCX08_05320 [Candidatus Buchananbacteria bacterium]|jgi:hypothetical protein